MASSAQTRASLLERLRGGSDPCAWREFFDRYWRVMFGFARSRGCSNQTAEDVVQDAMLAVFRHRQVFRYDPERGHFRNWLFTIVRHLADLRYRRQARAPEGRADRSGKAVAAQPAWSSAPEVVWNDLFESDLLLAMLEIIRLEVDPRTYQAFDLTVLHGMSGRDAARLTGLSRNAVYQARKRVMARLRELGAPYRDSGRLHDRVKHALALLPSAAGERNVATRVDTTFTRLEEASA